ncbi:MAG: hypothetical protein GPOALKHO_000381 [Sodalis sp.]|nr:MAG: hypothetical protein GPOALKHO_000381 [Sodalis sp.]
MHALYHPSTGKHIMLDKPFHAIDVTTIDDLLMPINR